MPRILAIDYGTKRTGLAWTDPLQIIATALETIPTDDFWPYLTKLMKQEEIEAVVLGFPTRLDGSDTHLTETVRELAAEFPKRFPQLPLHLWDERYTSQQAMETMIASGISKSRRRDKSLIDKLSATILLQDFMQAHSS